MVGCLSYPTRTLLPANMCTSQASPCVFPSTAAGHERLLLWAKARKSLAGRAQFSGLDTGQTTLDDLADRGTYQTIIGPRSDLPKNNIKFPEIG